MELIGRKAETDRLNGYVASNESEFIVVYGRRRVGKTFLIRKYFNDSFFFYMTGVSNTEFAGVEHAGADSLKRLNLDRFDKALAERGIDISAPAATWMEAFDRLADAIKSAGQTERKVIFLDEMPWMDTPRSRFLTALEYFWNGFASGRNDVLLIACGSAASWMTKKLFRNRGGLYNRVTGMILVKPFTLAECEEYMKAKNVVIDRRDITEAYMIFGGIPYYLRYWDGRYSLPQNVDRILFYEDAPLKHEFDMLFSSLFGKSELYVKVVDALGSKSRGLTRDELIKILGNSDGGTISSVLRDLELSGFIRNYVPFPGKTNGGLLQLIDNYSLFHRTFIKRYKGGNEHYWSDMHETPKLNAWRGFAFEQVCLRHIDRIKAALGISGIASEVYSWRSKKSQPGAQIDLVIDRMDRIVNLCEIKFSKYEFEITKPYSENLKNKVRAFEQETRTRRTPHLTLISTYGLKKNSYAGMIQSEVTLNDMF